MLSIIQPTRQKIVVELRADATGFSVEINDYQVYWSRDEKDATVRYERIVKGINKSL